MSDFQSLNSLIKSSLTLKKINSPGPFLISNLVPSAKPPFYTPHNFPTSKDISRSKRNKLALTGDLNVSIDFLRHMGIDDQVNSISPSHKYWSEKRKIDVEFYPESSLSIPSGCPSFDSWYFVLKDFIYSFYRDRPLISSHKFSISISGKNIKIDFKIVRLTIICKGTLYDLASMVNSRSYSPFSDLLSQVLIPLASDVINIDSIISKKVSSFFSNGRLPSHQRLSSSNLNFDNIKNIITDHVSDLIEEEILFHTFESLVSCMPYCDHFPSRKLKRNITIIIAPTNSGKTYRACEMIKDIIDYDPDATANCLFPLRALAYQIKDDFIESKYPCSLITGEEREIDSFSRISCCTTETIDTSIYNKAVFIDECQLIFDKSRESSYSRAIFGAYCSELILSVAPSYSKALIDLINKFTDDNVNIIEMERLCPLEPAGSVKAMDIEKGDVIIAYRVSSIHKIAEYIESYGLKVGVIYGKMSPSSRRKMISEFSNRDCDVLVATDAIGMGLSIPAKRVFLAEGVKFDGSNVRQLTNEEIRQVAGRAGRFGYYDVGYAGVISLPEIIDPKRMISEELVNNAISTVDSFKIPSKISVSPDKHVIRSANDISLYSTLEIWKKSVISHDDIEVSVESYSLLLDKAIILDRTNSTNRKLLVDLLFIVYPSDSSGAWEKIYSEMVNHCIDSLSLKGFHWDHHLKSHFIDSKISTLENKSAYLTLLSQFQRVCPELCPSENIILAEQEKVGESLANLLLDRYAPSN